MLQPILITGAAGGSQGATGRVITELLRERGIPVRAFVHKLDQRSDALRKLGVEIVEGDLLNPASVRAAMQNLKRAYFTYPVVDGLLEATTIFASAAREAGIELLVNNSQAQGLPDDPGFRDLGQTPSFRNLQHRLADRIFDWAGIGAVHLQAPPYYENVRTLLSRSVAERNAVLLPWGKETTIIPLVGAEDVARVAVTLLSGPAAPAQTVYPLVSQTPSVKGIVEALSRAIGRPLQYVAITDAQWSDAVRQRINPHALDHLTHLWQYFREGNRQFRTSDTIRAVTGRDPQTLAEFFQSNVEAFKVGAGV